MKENNCHHSESEDGKLMCKKEGIRPDTECGHDGENHLCKSFNFPRRSANFIMNTHPDWLKKMAEDDDCECCSAGSLLMPTIGVSDFVKIRHLEHLQFTHYKGSWDDLIAHVDRQIALGNWSEGYRDGVRLVHMPKDEASLFYGYDGFKKFEGMKMDAVFEKVPGREHEPAKLQIRILEPKIRMRYVDIIIYRKDVLEEDGDPVTGADWEVISVNGRLRKNPDPMRPLTMVRNYRHLPGGSSMTGKDPVEFLDELMDAVLFDKGMKHLIKKKK